MQSTNNPQANELDARLNAIEATGVNLDNLERQMQAQSEDQQLLHAFN